MIQLVLAIGFSIDNVAHYCHAYMSSTHSTRKEKAIDALQRILSPILACNLSTMSALLCLLSSKSKIFMSFFKVLFTVLLLGALHSTVLLPVILAHLGPQNIAPRDEVECEKREVEGGSVTVKTVRNLDDGGEFEVIKNGPVGGSSTGQSNVQRKDMSVDSLLGQSVLAGVEGGVKCVGTSVVQKFEVEHRKDDVHVSEEVSMSASAEEQGILYHTTEGEGSSAFVTNAQRDQGENVSGTKEVSARPADTGEVQVCLFRCIYTPRTKFCCMCISSVFVQVHVYSECLCEGTYVKHVSSCESMSAQSVFVAEGTADQGCRADCCIPSTEPARAGDLHVCLYKHMHKDTVFKFELQRAISSMIRFQFKSF